MSKLLIYGAQRLEGDFPPYTQENVMNAPEVSTAGKRSIFSFACGRSGQRWVTKIFQLHDNCNGYCERFQTEEAIHKYVSYYKLPVDLSGYYHIVKQSMHYDWAIADISVIASPYHCFGAKALIDHFTPDTVMANFRKAEGIVNSYYTKGYYCKTPVYSDFGKTPGPQGNDHPNHYFGRVTPKGEEFARWSKMTPVGRIAWFLSEAASAIHADIMASSVEDKCLFRIEDLDGNYKAYLALAERFGLAPRISEERFLACKGSMGNIRKQKIQCCDWTSQEKKEFEQEIARYVDIYDSLGTIV